MIGESLDVEALLAEARKALRCLYIAVDESIARDVSAKVEAALAAATARAEAAEAREAALRASVEAFAEECERMAASHADPKVRVRRGRTGARLRALLATGGAE